MTSLTPMYYGLCTSTRETWKNPWQEHFPVMHPFKSRKPEFVHYCSRHRRFVRVPATTDIVTTPVICNYSRNGKSNNSRNFWNSMYFQVCNCHWSWRRKKKRKRYEEWFFWNSMYCFQICNCLCSCSEWPVRLVGIAEACRWIQHAAAHCRHSRLNVWVMVFVSDFELS